MEYITDLHVHSPYARAVSKDMTLETMATVGEQKGVRILATADFTHPDWFRELTKKLEQDEGGLYRLKGSVGPVRFVPSTELSCIYSQDEKGRRIHILVIAPDLETVGKITTKLGWQSNLKSDGRPILGMSAKELAELVLESSSECLLIPAHVWTPWFSLFGSMSGFDRLTDCFGEFAEHVPAIETGLSSDPQMNWRLSQLDDKQIVSFSDAHSPANMGREATVFALESLTYAHLANALRNPSQQNHIVRTIEFFPEEGKYHYDGHRNCDVRWSPKETAAHNAICPQCGKRVTVGVMSRVEELADRPEDVRPQNRPPYVSIVPLAEIIADVLGIGKATKGVQREYDTLVNAAAGRTEFSILLDTPVRELERLTRPDIAKGIQAVREGKLHIEPGYDGVFGTVAVEAAQEDNEQQQLL